MLRIGLCFRVKLHFSHGASISFLFFSLKVHQFRRFYRLQFNNSPKSVTPQTLRGGGVEGGWGMGEGRRGRGILSICRIHCYYHPTFFGIIQQKRNNWRWQDLEFGECFERTFTIKWLRQRKNWAHSGVRTKGLYHDRLFSYKNLIFSLYLVENRT